MNKTAIVIIAIVVVLGAGFLVWQSGILSRAPVEPASLPSGIVLFSSPSCPYCKIVSDFISENRVTEKLQLTKLEVSYGTKTNPQLKANSSLLVQVAGKCGEDTRGGVPIPFLYDGENSCFVGYDEIINFLKEKAGIN